MEIRKQTSMHDIIRVILLVALFSPSTFTTSLHAQPYKGWPSHDSVVSLAEGFLNPPKGYGNVPFYWWNGDTLKMDRLLSQLELLSDASVDGFSVSYIHTHPEVDKEVNAHGYGSFGRPDPGIPGIFTDEWWSLWNRFSAQCAERGIGLGLDDYVVGWRGNGLYVDEVVGRSDFQHYQGRLVQNPDGSISTVASPELHPDYGKRLVEAYFGRFEQRLDSAGRRGMNYFFQDELQYPLNIHSWCEDMPEQFMARKGYDIVPLLPLLFKTDIDTTTARVRLDYAEVLTQLAEERYFRPIFNWHQQRGLIYGCDNEGRGLEPLAYLDYFRAISWFTAPGNDAPARGSSFRQTKVSSSVAHLYQRPRTWLEAFHSMGWNSNGAWLTRQLDHHLIAGGNLLCLHGLYYSTHGGWWEWAPPCFHFRMPYWPHMKHWLRYAERMCYVLSQGSHVCDIAVLYPTEELQAYPGTSPEPTFRVTDQLSESGIDYDYIDYQSLQHAEIGEQCFTIAGEKYQALLLPQAKMLHHKTQYKIEQMRAAGIPVITGTDNIVAQVSQSVNRDFLSSSGRGRVLHRRVGDQDLYMIMDVADGDTLRLHATGKAEQWDAHEGKIYDLPILTQDNGETTLIWEGTEGSARLYVFSPGTPTFASPTEVNTGICHENVLAGEWETTLVPTMDNRWGDFRLPASKGLIGAEIREMKAMFVPEKIRSSRCPVIPDSIVPRMIGYEPYFEEISRNDSIGRPYYYSWQYGVQDAPGSQGYHGLKGKVDDRFFILDQGGDRTFVTKVFAPVTGIYRSEIEGVTPTSILVDGEPFSGALSSGWHDIQITYTDTHAADYTLAQMHSYTVDRRNRSAVVFYKSDLPVPVPYDPYGNIVAMKWYGTDHLPYNIYGGQKGRWVYEMKTAPGCTAMYFKEKGKLARVWVDGKALKRNNIIQKNDSCLIRLPGDGRHVRTITIEALPEVGVMGTDFFDGPISLTCGIGMMPVGDWTTFGAMKYYSGGVKYAKHVNIKTCPLKAVLHLGEVDASCEVYVNNQKVGILFGPPYDIDITDYIKNGDNHIEILVYSSLSNHYQSVPTPYRGTPHAGLLQEVRLETTDE